MAVHGTYPQSITVSPRRRTHGITRSIGSPDDRELIDVTTRLYQRFGDQHTLVDILDVVDSCRRDLDLATTGGLPELVERLATQRLLDRTGNASDVTPQLTAAGNE